MKTVKCHDKTMSRSHCKTKKKYKGCVESGMGGHPGAFTDVQLDNCTIACGKKISKSSKTELKFYNELYSISNLPPHLNALKNYLPKYYASEKCSKGKNEYFIIENIKSDLGKNIKTLDFKIGFKTAFKFDKGYLGSLRHKIIDRQSSISHKKGFRLEGITGKDKYMEQLVEKSKKNKKISGYKKTPLERGKKKNQIALYSLDPGFVFDYFFEKQSEVDDITVLLNKMKDEFIIPSLSSKETIALIGSSILLAKGSKKATLRLIDFAHPLWNNPKSSCCKKRNESRHKKATSNYLFGLLNFITEFDVWRKKSNFK